jgi:hypothetical protein
VGLASAGLVVMMVIKKGKMMVIVRDRDAISLIAPKYLEDFA